jgi:hypothetical protein
LSAGGGFACEEDDGGAVEGIRVLAGHEEGFVFRGGQTPGLPRGFDFGSGIDQAQRLAEGCTTGEVSKFASEEGLGADENGMGSTHYPS